MCAIAASRYTAVGMASPTPTARLRKAATRVPGAAPTTQRPTAAVTIIATIARSGLMRVSGTVRTTPATSHPNGTGIRTWRALSMSTPEPCPVPEPVAAAPRPAPGRSCCSVIFVDESAEDRSSPDRHSQIDHPVGLVVRCLLLPALMRSMLVVVRLPIGESPPQMPLVHDQKMVQAFTP